MIEELLWRIKQKINHILSQYKLNRTLKNAPNRPWGLVWIDKKRKYRTIVKAIENAKPGEFIFVTPKKEKK